jgi:ribosomal RNA-processing protein 36
MGASVVAGIVYDLSSHVVLPVKVIGVGETICRCTDFCGVAFYQKFRPAVGEDPGKIITMPLSTKLDRKLRAVEDDSDNEEYYEVTDRSSPSVIDTGEGADILSSESEGEDAGEDDEEEVRLLGVFRRSMLNYLESEEPNDGQFQRQMSKVTFGALAKAQDALSKQSSRKRKRGEDTSTSQEDKLQALRERLREIKAAKAATGAAPSSKKSKTSTKAKPTRQLERDDDEESDGSDDSETAPRARSSKHAPAVQSSKRAVTRRRTVVEVKKPTARDPRFENVGGPRPDENTLNKRYAFLNEYRDSEMAELRQAIKKTKNEDDKEKLKRKLLSMESQKKARQNKEKQQEVVHEHKKKEKELIKQGKQPFYLKKCMFSPRMPRLSDSLANFQCSRAKETCTGRPLPEHEGEAAREGYRASSQEGCVQGAEEYAGGQAWRMSGSLVRAL